MFEEKYKLVLSPEYRIEDLLDFATIYSRLRDSLDQPLKNKEEEKEENQVSERGLGRRYTSLA